MRKRRLTWLLGAAALALLVLPARSAGAADPLTCAGYPQARQFVDAQSWWTQTPDRAGSDFGHAHLGACIPERQTISAPTKLDVRLVLHDNPGRFNSGSLVLKGTDYETTVQKFTASGFTCPAGTCPRWFTLPLDPAQFRHSGLQEVRFRGYVDEPDGNRMAVSLNWQLYVSNGKSRADVTRRPYLRGKGWYTGAGYCEASLASLPLPDAPISAPWNAVAFSAWHGESDDLPVTHHTARLDADFHAGIPGTVLVDGAGPWYGALTIDPSALAPGIHKLLVRTDCADPRGSTNSGVLVVGVPTA